MFQQSVDFISVIFLLKDLRLQLLEEGEDEHLHRIDSIKNEEDVPEVKKYFPVEIVRKQRHHPLHSEIFHIEIKVVKL